MGSIICLRYRSPLHFPISLCLLILRECMLTIHIVMRNGYIWRHMGAYGCVTDAYGSIRMHMDAYPARYKIPTYIQYCTCCTCGAYCTYCTCCTCCTYVRSVHAVHTLILYVPHRIYILMGGPTLFPGRSLSPGPCYSWAHHVPLYCYFCAACRGFD